MDEGQEGYSGKIEKRRKGLRYCGRLFLLAVALGIWTTVLTSRGWAPHFIMFMLLGLVLALAVLFGWLTETIHDGVNRWAVRAGLIRHSASGSIVAYPRVWDFQWDLPGQSIERLLAARGLIIRSDPCSEGNEQSVRRRQDELDTARVKIEEYVNRVRVHTWRSTFLERASSSMYTWTDLDRDIYTSFDIFTSTEFPIWRAEYPIDGEKTTYCILRLTLSGGKRRHLQLTLWIERPSRRERIAPMSDEEYLRENPNDIVFTVPLEPDILGNHKASPNDEPGKICFDPQGGGLGVSCKGRWGVPVVLVPDLVGIFRDCLTEESLIILCTRGRNADDRWRLRSGSVRLRSFGRAQRTGEG